MRRYVVLIGFVIALLAVAAACSPGEEKTERSAASVATDASMKAEPGVIGAGPPVGAPPPSATGSLAVEERGAKAVADSGSSTSSLADPSIIDRKIIYNASLDLAVEDVTPAFDAVQRIAQGVGGIVSAANFYKQDDHRLASVTLRVPVSAYQDVLTQLRRLAVEVRSETSNAKDITEEYADLEARLRNLQATERQYLQLLTQAKSIADILLVQDRLNATRGEIERVQGRVQLLTNLSDMAIIQVQLRPLADLAKEGPQVWDPARVAADAWDASLAAMRRLAGALIVIAIYSSWAVVPAAIALLVWRRRLARRTAVD